MPEYVPLHVHSHYSFFQGANSIRDLCRHARSRGHHHLALTDTNGLYGLAWFLQEARSCGLQPLIGSYLIDRRCSAVVLAKNVSGYSRLCRLITLLQSDAEFDLTRALIQDHKDLVLISRDRELLKAIISTSDRTDVYAELVPYLDREAMLQFARSFQLPVAATQAAYFISPEDHSIHKLLRAIDLQTTLSTLAKEEVASPYAFMDSLESRFPDCPEALSNTLQIARECTFELNFHQSIFPAFHGPKGESAFAYLDEQVRQGAQWRYGALTPDLARRLEYELDLIKQKGFAPYFLVVADAVRQAPRTCGRGSAASSIVSYCLGITNVDPVRYDLFFDRFLNPGRKDPPDIDVDFPWDERDDVLDYVFKKYGGSCVAMIANHVTFKARSAVREIAKVYGLPETEISVMTSRMSSHWQPTHLEQMMSRHPVFRNIEIRPPWPEIIRQAEKIRGFPRYLSIHCGGVVIVPDGLDRYVPVQPAKKLLKPYNLKEGGVPRRVARLQVVQWEKDQAEDMGLVKMDLLGNRSLSVIRDTIRAVASNHGVVIDYASWDPLQDKATQSLLARGDTIGVFYVESPAMRQLQKKTGKGDFEHLIIHSSIIRPAANIYINEYIRRLKGGGYEPLHPKLEEVLRETFGIMVYQEDVSKVAMALADFDASSADDLRKVVGKKHKRDKLEEYRKRFYLQAIANQVSRNTCDKIWQMILSFSEYSFCKAHSASYAQVSFKSAYLKVYYPAEFMAAVISNQGGYYSTLAYISESRRLGLQVLPPDINESDFVYTGTGKCLRVGFMQIKGLSSQAWQAIIKERKNNGPFKSLDHLHKRVALQPADLFLLIKAGCLDSLAAGRTRPDLLWQAYYRQSHRPAPSAQASFDFFDQEEAASRMPANTRSYDEKEILRQEVETLGFLISRHPLTLYQERIDRLVYTRACDLDHHIGETVQTIGWLITYKLIATKHKQLMEFLSFEDTTAIYETIFFPKIYERFAHMMTASRPYLLKGRVEEQYGAVVLNVHQVNFL
ncbi:MAG TPA: DNA polymerase III subunit alpha [bacterium]|nr:DNA polymerase III subunit alpha [bacterium]